MALSTKLQLKNIREYLAASQDMLKEEDGVNFNTEYTLIRNAANQAQQAANALFLLAGRIDAIVEIKKGI